MGTANLRRWAADVESTGAATTADIKVPDDTTNDFIYVTKIVITFKSHANAKQTQIVDSAGTPVVYITIDDLTPATGLNNGAPFVYDFGRRGLKMTKGKKLQVLGQASGSVVHVYAEGYQALI